VKENIVRVRFDTIALIEMARLGRTSYRELSNHLHARELSKRKPFQLREKLYERYFLSEYKEMSKKSNERIIQATFKGKDLVNKILTWLGYALEGVNTVSMLTNLEILSDRMLTMLYMYLTQNVVDYYDLLLPLQVQGVTARGVLADLFANGFIEFAEVKRGHRSAQKYKLSEKGNLYIQEWKEWVGGRILNIT
jgi:hypothetical protein